MSEYECACMRVRACMYPCMHVSMHACHSNTHGTVEDEQEANNSYIQTYIHTHRHASTHACMHACMHNHMVTHTQPHTGRRGVRRGRERGRGRGRGRRRGGPSLPVAPGHGASASPLRPCTWLPVDCWPARRMRAKACSQSEGICLHMQPPRLAARRACAGSRGGSDAQAG